MELFKRIIEKLKKPSLIHIICTLILGAVFIAAILCAVKGVVEWAAYVCYAVAALLLAYLIYILIWCLPKIKARTLNYFEGHTFANNLVNNYGYRTVLFACGSMVLNTIYAIYNAAIAIYYYSVWFGILAMYYLALSAMRGGLIFGDRRLKKITKTDAARFKEKAVKSYIACGICLVAFTAIIVGGMVRLIVSEKNETRSSYLIYATALYTFIRVGWAIHNGIKAKKVDDFITKSLRNVNLSDALVSILALQTSMLAAFANGYNVQLYNMLTGIFVCAFSITIGIYMIINGNAVLRQGETNAKRL